MGLDIQSSGNGFVAPTPGDGWRINQNGCPVILGDSAGRLGDLSFDGPCDSTTKFSIDNYLTIKHYFDSGIDRHLTSFNGHVRSVTIDEGYADFAMTSILDALDVERTTSLDMAGTYQRTIELPTMEYEIPGIGTYWTGGYWTSIGADNVFVPTPISILDVTSERNYVYVLAQGGHNGQVVFVFGNDGNIRSLWPVYSDATDLAGPDSAFITYAAGAVWIGQKVAKRVKRFTIDGGFLSQWGSAGSADGQFQAISGLAADPDFSSVFVTDSVLGRVQRFNRLGVFQNKWGTVGTGSGTATFNGVNNISVEPGAGHVFVSDNYARVRQYDSYGNYQTQPMGSYDFSTSTSTGEFVAGQPIVTGFDHLRNAYAIQNGNVFKYMRGQDGSWTSSSKAPIRGWTVPGYDDPFTAQTAMRVNPESGIMYIANKFNSIRQYAGSTGTVYAYFLYIVALATSDFPLTFAALEDEDLDVNFIAWTDNVWNKICELCAISGNVATAFNDRIYIQRNSTERGTTIPSETQMAPIPLELNSRATGRAIEIWNYNSRYTDGYEVLYSAEVDGGRTFGIDLNGYTTLTVSQDTYPEYVFDPTPTATYPAAPGTYMVIDKDKLIVTPSLWLDYGGSVRATPGARPGTIDLAITGPGLEIPGFNGPFVISSISGQPALSVLGSGVVSTPELITIGTGVTEDISNKAVAKTIDSPFSRSAQIAYTEGSWAAYDAGTPNQSIQLEFPIRFAPQYGSFEDGTSAVFSGLSSMLTGTFPFDEAQYVVSDISYNRNTVTINARRYSSAGYSPGSMFQSPRFEEIWSGVPTGTFEAFWAGYTAQDFTIAPYRNPFGV